MKHFYIIFFVCLHFFNSSFSQKTLLKGLVLDDYGAPISYATITIKGEKLNGKTTLSDKDGHFIMPVDLELDTTIKCTRVGFENYSQKIERNTYLVLSMKHEIDNIKLPSLLDTITYQKSNLIHIEKTSQEKYLDSFFNSETDKVFTRVEIESAFSGGKKAIFNYIKTNFKISDSANTSNTKGTIKVGFVIGEDGYVKNVNILSGINKYYDEAILKIIKVMPKWTPAMQNGRYVSSYKELYIPINIEIKIQ